MVKNLLGDHGPAFYMDRFTHSGIVDPDDGMVHAQAPRHDNDLAVISLARNPFGEKFASDWDCDALTAGGGTCCMGAHDG